MKTKKNKINITKPINQLNLFGYDNYFDSFAKLLKLGKLPKAILLTGPKGLGKSTFLYHFINFILSKDEEKKYSIEDHRINDDNISYKLLTNNTHPNFFLLDKSTLDKEIKIENVRNLRKFLIKTSYSKNLKLVLIDNAETLNQNSLNALLKPIEEPSVNTHFFIVYNKLSKIPDTLKSRCFEYKIFFNENDKKKILDKIVSPDTYNSNLSYIDKIIYSETPGNILNYMLNFKVIDESILSSTSRTIFYLIEAYKKDKNKNTLSTLLYLIEIFYNELCIINSKNINIYFFNYMSILNKLNDMKKYNLDEKNVLFQVSDIIKDER